MKAYVIIDVLYTFFAFMTTYNFSNSCHFVIVVVSVIIIKVMSIDIFVDFILSQELACVFTWLWNWRRFTLSARVSKRGVTLHLTGRREPIRLDVSPSDKSYKVFYKIYTGACANFTAYYV